jgi:chromosome segregation ATPase
MAADVTQFTNAVDKVYKTFSTQEVHLDKREMKGLGERGTIRYIEDKFQQQLQKARSAFIAEFRNHSVVVESEVQKIRKELTASLELKYGEQIAELKQQAEQCDKLVSKHQDQIAHLKSLAAAQEAYLTAARHRWGLEQREKLRAEIQSLRDELEASRREGGDLSHQLMCRDELVAQLRGELSNLEVELKKQAGTQQEEKHAYEERLRGLRLEMRQQQDQFKEHLRSYEDRFSEYRAKTTSELQIQDILNTRRSEALSAMEEERLRHIKARTKPTARIGNREDLDESQEQIKFEPAVIKDARYRVDDMGMDTSWRDYQLADLQLVPPNRKPGVPKFRVHRGKQSVGPNAQKASDQLLPANLTPRQHDLGPSVMSPPNRY